MEYPKITLIGVGLLGGSVGMAVKKLGLAGCVTGFVRRVKTIDECLAFGAVDEATQNLEEAVSIKQEAWEEHQVLESLSPRRLPHNIPLLHLLRQIPHGLRGQG